MHKYDIDQLYVAVAKELFTECQRAKATGGKNNIRARGDGPEKIVREWIANSISA